MPGTARVLAGRLVRVLAAVAADPGVRVRGVEVLEAAERAQLVGGWNDTAREVPAVTVPGLFAAQAGRCAGCGGGGVRGRGGDVRGSWMRRRGGWRGCWRGTGRGRSGWWRW